MSLLTRHLIPGDVVLWDDSTDYVLSIDWPSDPRVVVARVNVERVSGRGHVSRSHFYAGLDAIQTVVR